MHDDREGIRLFMGKEVVEGGDTLSVVTDLPPRNRSIETASSCTPLGIADEWHLRRYADSIMLEEIERRKYFRLAAHDMIDDEGLSELLSNEEMGEPYGRGTKSTWCG